MNSVSPSVKWDVYPFLIGCCRNKRNEASKHPVALGGGILALGLPAGHRGPEAWSGLSGLEASLLQRSLEEFCSLSERPVGTGKEPIEKGSPESSS